ncbi:benzoate/H(+) symporter BenE family transporter [Cryobacterium sp. TMT2-15-1]|uniref:benzoate/H(+) symporter BenE family transporter n=1 Tax=Cryobacterium sp. TMT2-15-1 TaxID=1259246 RepID=UPI0018E0A266|nr:benzoate/H(+) symporter BenE family transporter [Cryobacterium sp. TMT2-15-1]
MVGAAIIDVRLPASALRDLVGSGLANAFGSVVGALGINLTAITTAPMAGPDAHPDGLKRWIATAASGAACLVLVTASGVSVSGIGSAFGVLVIGGVVMLWPGWMPSGRSHPTAVAAP